ncbi:HpcH/HpaI aldolase/citrate lyase family protein [Streptosporangium subroseum]|uniref:HpcH/HpaI aldolase/citrate lyase family protein n=1 Tax=Streptosporangium subroseum TaxID=106412 RepID=UPI00308A99C2|nr:CoA ester lyase [Streptosporangium subroseum]
MEGPNGEGQAVDVPGARSWLFVPGDRGDRFAKAAASGADVVVCDLEDAVAVDAKEPARAEVARWLGAGGVACVRVNARGTPFHDADVSALSGVRGLRAVMLPKAEDPRALGELSDALGPDTVVVALVETALGLHRAYDLASAPGVVRLAFGSIDFALDLGAEETPTSMLFARSSLVVASRAARVAAPIDGVTVALDDLSVVEAEAATAAGLGFGGKLCVHPRQVSAVNAAFSPGEEEVRRARRILDSVTDGGAGRLDGQMIDRPVVERARLVLRRAGVEPTPDDPRRS